MIEKRLNLTNSMSFNQIVITKQAKAGVECTWACWSLVITRRRWLDWQMAMLMVLISAGTLLVVSQLDVDIGKCIIRSDYE
jgi:hypothetical protein